MISLLNILNLISVLFSLAFQVLLVRLFGAALQTDVYYLSIGITQFINGIFTGFLTDLYIPVYNDVKVRSEEEAKRFTGAVFTLMLIISALLSILVFILAPYIIRLFASGFTADKIAFSVKLVRILSISILFSSLTGVINPTLNANLFMSITYSTNLITPLFNVIALLFLAETYGIRAIIYSLVIASFISFVIVFLYMRRKIGWKSGNPFSQSDMGYLLKQNVPIKAGNLIYQLRGPIATNILSYFPAGYITLFNYASKVLDVLFKITNSPTLQILYVKASNLLSSGRIDELKTVLLSTIRSNTILFIGLLIPAMILFKDIFGYLFSSKVTQNQISVMYFLFLALIPYYLSFSFEMPFVQIAFAMKSGRKVLQIAIVSIILYSFCLLVGINFIGIYVVPLALFLAQLYNTVTYASFVNQNLHVIDSDILTMMLKFSAYAVLLISLNLIVGNHFLHRLFLNVFLVFIGFLLIRRDMAGALRFITRWGEIR